MAPVVDVEYQQLVVLGWSYDDIFEVKLLFLDNICSQNPPIVTFELKVSRFNLQDVCS